MSGSSMAKSDHRQRSSRESLKLSEGASPLSKSSSKYSTKSSGSDRSVEADPLFHQLHPMLSSVFGQDDLVPFNGFSSADSDGSFAQEQLLRQDHVWSSTSNELGNPSQPS
ncbi:calcium-binding protein 1 isoform x1 [Limosa lapponica baueri]|uniref:Calcium-binding protein 1 isoform x1 n=1 Tax=Limosa lapponica baueri TaxID=1758121 RepID=A0A2I0TXU5_LIMLA|nr:calcium-binding protein 1 isoform x1 [Limosa lapponica baueri]